MADAIVILSGERRRGGSVMELSDEELEALHSCVFDEVIYGDDSVVYGDDEYAVNLRAALTKVTNEAKRRKLWWAR